MQRQRICKCFATPKNDVVFQFILYPSDSNKSDNSDSGGLYNSGSGG